MSVDLAGFLVVVTVAYLIPGPDFLVIARSAAQSRRAGLWAALGAQSGLCVHMVLAAVGLSTLAAHSALAFSVLKVVGACYLLWLGARIVWSSRHSRARCRRREDTSSSGPARDGGRDRRREHFRQALLTNLLNPKAALFFLSVLPQFIDTSASAAPQIFLLGVIDVLLGIVFWWFLVLVIRRVADQLDRPLVRTWWDRVTGGLLAGAGTTLAATST